jgi:integrase
MKKITLPGPFGSDEFMRAYQMALMGSPAPTITGASRTLPGTLSALRVSYCRSDAWNNLDEETRKTRRRVIDKLCTKHGDKRVAMLRREHIINMLAEIVGASARRSWFKAMRPLFQHAVPTMLREDPTAGIATSKLPKTKGHHSWTDGEIERYCAHWAYGTQQRLIFGFALETVSRRGEVVRLGPQHPYTGSKGEPRIRIARIHGSDDVDIPVTPELQAAIDAMPRAHLTFIVTAYGRPRSKFGLGTDFAKWATEACLPTECRLHGLKKAGISGAAEAGNTTHELMARSGHKTLAEVDRYTEAANKKRLADSGDAKIRAQSANNKVTNLGAGLVNIASKSLK